jgi:hypothetical protein
MMAESHYDSNTFIIRFYPVPAPTHMLKILQEMYVSIMNKDVVLMQYTIIADGNVYSPVSMRTDRLIDYVLSPLHVKYGKVKIRINIPASGCCLREWGYSFTVPPQGLAQHIDTQLAGIGMNSGLNAGIGL